MSYNASGDQVDRLADQTKLSLNLQNLPVPNGAGEGVNRGGLSPEGASAKPPSPLSAQEPSRPVNAIGSGGGGPQPRMPTTQSNADRIGTGGPGGRLNAHELTRQMATARLPPSLQARLAANANRSPSSSSSPARTNEGTPQASIGADGRLDVSAFTSRTQGSPAPSPGGPQAGASSTGTANGAFKVPAGLRPAPGLPPGARPPNAAGPGPMTIGGLGARRKGPGLRLSDMSDDKGSEAQSADSAASTSQKGPVNGAAAGGNRRLAPPGKLASAGKGLMSSAFEMHKNIVDPSGQLRFDGKAVLSASGVEFRNGTSFKINMEELDLLEELGKGAYGTVRKVRHTKTHVLMAMKEIRLELDDSKLNGIIMELDILHRATAPEIVEFYGAFFYESCVYYCIEFMDASSLDRLYDGPCSVPEDVLARIVGCMVRGLRFLKDNLQIMHRDVKPTNVLLNKAGEVKLCDFGVSGQLEKSLAKTNIGCQSYMAPERIKGESQNLVGTYTVASDVWSLGLSIVETTLGTYPYPPETYSNVFAQLQAIVHGEPPQIPQDFYSETARDFVAGCLIKIPSKRSTYRQMLEHPWLVADREKGPQGVDMVGWVRLAIERTAARREKERSEAKIG